MMPLESLKKNQCLYVCEPLAPGSPDCCDLAATLDGQP